MQPIRTDRITTIAGIGGTGKTNMVKLLLASLTIPYTLYDPLDQYPEVASRVVPDPDTKDRYEAECERVWRQGNHLLVTEECELYMPNNKELTPYCKRVVLRGRNYGIGMWNVTRRIADVHKTPVGQSQHLFLFRMFLPNDCDYLRKVIGKYADQLPTLPPYHFLHYCEGEVELCPPLPLAGG